MRVDGVKSNNVGQERKSRPPRVRPVEADWLRAVDIPAHCAVWMRSNATSSASESKSRADRHLAILLSYYLTILLSYYLTILLSYYLTILLSYYLTILLSYYLNFIIKHKVNTLLSCYHNKNIAQSICEWQY